MQYLLEDLLEATTEAEPATELGLWELNLPKVMVGRPISNLVMGTTQLLSLNPYCHLFKKLNIRGETTTE